MVVLCYIKNLDEKSFLILPGIISIVFVRFVTEMSLHIYRSTLVACISEDEIDGFNVLQNCFDLSIALKTPPEDS